MADDRTPPDAGLIAIKVDDLRKMLNEAGEHGAETLMQRLGIEDEDDIKDIREAIAVGAFWRNLRKSFVESVGKRIAAALWWAMVFGAVAALYMAFAKVPTWLGKG